VGSERKVQPRWNPENGKQYAGTLAYGWWRQFTPGEPRYFLKSTVSGGAPDADPPRVYEGSEEQLGFGEMEPEEWSETGPPSYNDAVYDFHYNLAAYPYLLEPKWPVKFAEVTDTMHRWTSGTDEITFTLSKEVLWTDFRAFCMGKLADAPSLGGYEFLLGFAAAINREGCGAGRITLAKCDVRFGVYPPIMPGLPCTYKVTATVETIDSLTGAVVESSVITKSIDITSENGSFAASTDAFPLPAINHERRIVQLDAEPEPVNSGIVICGPPFVVGS